MEQMIAMSANEDAPDGSTCCGLWTDKAPQSERDWIVLSELREWIAVLGAAGK